MFWNREKKIIKKQRLDKKAETAPSNRIFKKVSLTFLKRLIPVGHLPGSDLQQLKTSLSSHVPGDVIFNAYQSASSLPYLVKGQCYVEAINGSGYLVDAATFKALYPLSNSQQYQCTVIAKTDVKILHFPVNVLNKSQRYIRNPLLNAADVPEQLQNNSFYNDFCQYFKDLLHLF